MMYDAGPPLFYFFIFFKVKLPTQSAEKCVCMVKTRAKIWAELFCALDLFVSSETFSGVAPHAKEVPEKISEKIGPFFLVKQLRNCKFLAKNH